MYDGDIAVVAGHEVCGKVLSVGGKVPEDRGPRVGDVVVVYPWPGCGQCETCSTENWQLCDEHCSTSTTSDAPTTTSAPAVDDTQSSLASFQARTTITQSVYLSINTFMKVDKLQRDVLK